MIRHDSLCGVVKGPAARQRLGSLRFVWQQLPLSTFDHLYQWNWSYPGRSGNLDTLRSVEDSCQYGRA